MSRMPRLQILRRLVDRLKRLGCRRVPAGSGAGRRRRRGGDGGWRPFPGDADGGASVREPRRPVPAPPTASAAAEPPQEQHLDLSER